MDLRQLKYFYHVANDGSFTKAAENLHIAQPALSLHVRRLEEELGVSLLFRGPRGVKLTEAGTRLMDHAGIILKELAAIPDSVRGEAVSPSGIVRLGVEGTILEQIAVPVIEEARALYPDIHIRIIESCGYLLEWLNRGQLDIAIVYATDDPRGVKIHHALSEELCLFAATDFPANDKLRGDTLDFAHVSELPLIVPTAVHALREALEESALLRNVQINPAVEINSYSQIKELVRRGLGVGVLPRNAVENEANGIFQIWHLENPKISRNVSLAYSAERPLLNASRAIGQLSWNVLRRMVHEGIWIAELADEPNPPELANRLAGGVEVGSLIQAPP